MTVKELNKIRHETYMSAVASSEEVKNALRISDVVYLYDIREKDKRKIQVFTHIEQVNSAYLSEAGFTENAYIKPIMCLSRVTKTANWL